MPRRKSSAVAVILFVVEMLAFLAFCGYCLADEPQMPRNTIDDAIREAVEQVDLLSEEVDRINRGLITSKERYGKTIIVDQIEINHVYRHVEGDVVDHRLDQLILRNNCHVPKHISADNEVLDPGGMRCLVDGWSMLADCRDMSNKDHRKKWDMWLSNTLNGYSEIEKSEIRARSRYWGEFVSPVYRIGGYYAITLRDPGGDVTFKSKVYYETDTLYDAEVEDRRKYKRDRDYILNGYRNIPTVPRKRVSDEC